MKKRFWIVFISVFMSVFTLASCKFGTNNALTIAKNYFKEIYSLEEEDDANELKRKAAERFKDKIQG